MGPWKAQGGRRPELVKLLRGIGAVRQELLARDPWVPVPQRSCTFSFGEAGRPRRVGALLHLGGGGAAWWGRGPGWGGMGVGYTFGGFLAIGGIQGICLDCAADLKQRTAGGPWQLRQVEPVLEGTPFGVHRFHFGAAVPAGVRPLFEALAALGVEDLPPEGWVAAADRAKGTGVSLRAGGKRGSRVGWKVEG